MADTKFDFYEASVEPCIRIVDTFSVIIEKAKAHAAAATLPQCRIIEDMLPLTYQAHSLTKSALEIVNRVNGTEALECKYEDIKTWEDMEQRLAATKGLLQKLDREAVNSKIAEQQNLVLTKGVEINLTLKDLVIRQVMPNIWFHLTTAYNICRKEGVQLGKRDFLGVHIGPFVAITQ